MGKKRIASAAALLLAGLLTACGGAGAHYKKGMALQKEGKYEEALDCMEQAVKANPNKAEYYLAEGVLFTNLGRYEEAKEAFLKAVVEKDLELTRKNNKRANRGLGIACYLAQDYGAAKEYLQKALAEELLPEYDAELQTYLADTLVCTGDYVQALALYEELLKADKEDGDAQLAKADLLFLLGRYEESAAGYDAAITLLPGAHAPYFGKYKALGEAGDEKGQKETLEKLEQLANPTKEEAYYIAKAQFFCGDYAKALAGLTAALSNGYGDAHYYMAEIYRVQENYSEAVYHYGEYIKDGGLQNASVYNELAVCLLAQGSYEEALSAVAAGLGIADAACRGQLLRNEIVILERSGQYGQAYEKAQAYVAAYPDDEEGKKELEFLKTRVRD